MKYTLLILFILIAGACFGQVPNGYKKINGIRFPDVRYPEMNVPTWPTPPPITAPAGAIYLDTSNTKYFLLYVMTKEESDSAGKWLKIKWDRVYDEAEDIQFPIYMVPDSLQSDWVLGIDSIYLKVLQDTCIKDTSEAYITAMACDSCKERLRIGYVVTDTCQQPIVITFLDIRKQPLPPRVTVIKYTRKNDDQ
jgi:hypothetical protein